MVVISDTSVISNLIQLGLIDLLRDLFNEVIIPPSVKKELAAIPNHLKLLNSKTWIRTESIINTKLLDELLTHLDSGEAESIVLSIEMKASILLIDEKKGRRIATEYGINISGLIGVLIKAKEQLLIDELKPILNKLVYEIGFRIHPKLYTEVLQIVKEE